MTSINYEALNKAYRKQKAALTRAKNSNDPLKVLAAVESAVKDFNAYGWPDQWATWRIALNEAYWDFSHSDACDDDCYDNGGRVIRRFEACGDSFA